MNLKFILYRKLSIYFYAISIIFSIFIFTNCIYANDDIETYSNDILALDAESGNILYNKNGMEKVYPASTTKILTAILAIENLKLDDIIECSKTAIYSTPFESSSMYLRVGEQISVKDLLYGLLLQSGNDAANVLAEAVSGNIDDFVILMNKKLKEIGCDNTNFTNTHGFHEEDHYTTPYDMAKLMQYALKNNTFKEFIETNYMEVDKTNKTNEIRYYSNTNKMINTKSEYYYEYCVGGKTGYTEEARGTFVGYGEKDGKKVIVSTFDGSQNVSGKQARFLDSKILFDYCFTKYQKNIVFSKESFKFTITDQKNSKIYTIGINDDIKALYDNTDLNIDYNISLSDNIKLDTIAVGNDVGSIEIYAKNEQNNLMLTSNLVCTSVASFVNYQKLIWNVLKIIIYIVLILVGLVLILYSLNNILRKSKTYNKNLYYNTNIKMKRRSKKINRF